MTAVSEDRATLDSVLRHHLSLDPAANVSKEHPVASGISQSDSNVKNSKLKKRVSLKEFTDAPTSEALKDKNSTLSQGTVETGNKRRPVLMKRGSQKFEPLPPEPPDPNSEAKSVTIRRMQSNLEVWEEKLKELYEEKKENDRISKAELIKRDETIQELSTKYKKELKLRKETEQLKDQTEQHLDEVQKVAEDQSQQLQHLEMQLRQYTMAYQQSDSRKQELEEQLTSVSEQLQQSEGMRRRLHEQVTELQGRLALEEQRSKVCSIV